MKTAIELIAEERQRQISEEGYDIKHDDAHDGGELALAAACYAAHPLELYYNDESAHNKFVFEKLRPFGEYDIDDKKSELRRLTIAGALIIAEMERLQRIKTDED